MAYHGIYSSSSVKNITHQIKLAILKCGPDISGQTHVFSYNSSYQHPRCSVKKIRLGIHRYPEARILAGLVADQLQKWGCIQYVFDPTADSLLTVFFVLALQTLCLPASEEIRSDHKRKKQLYMYIKLIIGCCNHGLMSRGIYRDTV